MDFRCVSVDSKMKVDLLYFYVWQINLVLNLFSVFFCILMFIHSRMEKDGKVEFWTV